MNRRTDACPNACETDGQPVVAAPSTWTLTATGATGTYRCPACRRTWTTSYRADLDLIAWP